MSTQGDAWMKHTLAYLNGVDPNLATMFQHAMMHGDWPKVSIAEAFESMCADFLAGPHRQRIGKTFQDYADEVKRIVQPAADRQENIYGGCHSCGGWVYHSCPKPEATEPETCGGCGVRIDEGDHKECARRAWRE